MDYKNFLVERARMGQELAQEAAPLNWIALRNRDCLLAWYRRRAWPSNAAPLKANPWSRVLTLAQRS